ncbi:DUF1801 domain-containing protein [Fulvivirgaceae bacterium BMA12]|uniref:DUF1801 domain-containing protein n=1 Tax=Agaribacillus aureus TaxID=3051825 RepID=A0ABT8L8L6_9BACT|nr:DUF1801 domain-containing protein [Fulvivirgaceae bacterium BMA12]
MKLNATSIEAYFAAVPAERKQAMLSLRSLILSKAPEVKESFKYDLPFYSLNGKPFIALASQKHYMAFYLNEPMLIAKFKSELGNINTGKNCIRFKTIESIKLVVLGTLISQAYSKRKKNAG